MIPHSFAREGWTTLHLGQWCEARTTIIVLASSSTTASSSSSSTVTWVTPTRTIATLTSIQLGQCRSWRSTTFTPIQQRLGSHYLGVILPDLSLQSNVFKLLSFLFSIAATWTCCCCLAATRLLFSSTKRIRRYSSTQQSGHANEIFHPLLEDEPRHNLDMNFFLRNRICGCTMHRPFLS